jgi:hypothetical protein
MSRALFGHRFGQAPTLVTRCFGNFLMGCLLFPYEQVQRRHCLGVAEFPSRSSHGSQALNLASTLLCLPCPTLLFIGGRLDTIGVL